MTTRWQLTVVVLCTLLVTSTAHAQIYRWNTSEVIPGTEGIEPGPGVQLGNMYLERADLPWMDLTGANFEASNLTYANLYDSVLTDANLMGANLTGADFHRATLTGANLTGANLTGASLAGSTLTSANLTAAAVTGANFGGTVSHGFTQDQLYATASYEQKNLRGIWLAWNDLTGWDFSGQNLTSANLGLSTLTNANLTGANLTGATLVATNLRNARLSGANLTSAHITNLLDGFADLTNADLTGVNLTNADLRFSVLTNADLTGAMVVGTSFSHTTWLGFTQAQLVSTASYQMKDIHDIGLGANDLTGWDFSGQNLTSANLVGSTLTGANLAGANLASADLGGATLTHATYNQWTVFPGGFDPVAHGLTFMESPPGDFDTNDILDVADVDVLAERIRLGYVDSSGHWPDTMFDANFDSIIDQEDHRVWVKDLKNTWFGDANLDGEFNSGDMVQVFAAGKYETNEAAGWAQGDWNANGLFDSSDMVTAFVDGGYEKGPRTDAAAVPEPGGVLLLLFGLVNVMRGKRTAQDFS